MVTTLNFKSIIDVPRWRNCALPISSTNPASNNNVVLYSDLRNNEDRHPYIFQQWSGNFFIYSVKNDAWEALPGTGITASSAFYMSGQGPRGNIAAGATTTTITLATALPAAVGINSLADRGDGRGFKIRIIENAAGSSGLIEERYIIGNTSGTNPTITLDSPLSFTPILNDDYEFLSGRYYMMGDRGAAGQWKYWDVATNSLSGNLSVVNLPGAQWNSSNLIGFDDLLVPYDRNPGEGYLGNLTATATGAATLTGQAVGGDAGVLINEYRNFQIRIVQDIATPTAVGQRRNITSHTAGPSPVYTVPAWAVQPSATATYVIENNGDRMILWTFGSANTHTYTISTDSWDIVTYAARPFGAIGGGARANHAFSIEPDPAKNVRQSFIYLFNAGGGNNIDIFDIAGAATGTWTNNINYTNKNISLILSNGTFGTTQDPATNEGRYIYLQGGLQRFYRFDMKNQALDPFSYLRPPESTFAIAGVGGNHMIAYSVFVDGSTKLAFIYKLAQDPNASRDFLYTIPITS